MKYVQPSEFVTIGPASGADQGLWPRLGPDEFIVLDADLVLYHCYVRCDSVEQVQEAIQETLFNSLSQVLIRARAVTP